MAIDPCLITPFSFEHPEVLKIAALLNCKVNPADPNEFSCQIIFDESGLTLQDPQKRKLKIDFDQNHLDYQRKGHRGKNELIAKALGYPKGLRKVLDLSAGLGIDAFFMAQLGFSVVSYERSKLLFLLLDEAQKKSESIKKLNLKFEFGDSLDISKNTEYLSTFESVYFDPMYPHKKKSALPKQEMVIFRDLVGDDEDAKAVLEQVLKSSIQRVVVKRPVHAEDLLPGVKHRFEGKTVRFDLYL